ncbi:hypothetical protein PQG02_21130 [Nostoc sp. UHCC 0926]|uniref:hypothetical protein n=1 Tax=unclassified Nostoc TaxID=2593658 RepID=UPI0023613EE7|nr:hypothetical protein [Nostoc sp. UHCC 0926]WDD31213.1 hypothetical protein PQG02_21130 [Nostoc sp. UHCC 0926]
MTPSRDPNISYYYSSVTPSSRLVAYKGYATGGTYIEASIIWDKNNKVWQFYFGGNKIGQAANVGGPNSNGIGIDAGLESNSDKSVSDPAPLYRMQYATLDNWTWRDWPNPYQKLGFKTPS